MTPDLQRIVEALKACRERYLIVVPTKRGLDFGVRDLFSGLVAFSGTPPECSAYIDARCAEAMVRAIREPSLAMVEAAAEHGTESSDGGGWYYEPSPAIAWPAMCDVILGETQP